MKDKKNILIGALLFTIMVMAVGYAALGPTILNINGSAKVGEHWQVEITGITSTTTGNANAGTPTYTTSTATFDAELSGLEDTATYTITIENKGNIDATLDSIVENLESVTAGSPKEVIEYTVISAPSANSTLAAGGTTTVQVKASIKAGTNFAEIPVNTSRTWSATLEYVQAS